MDEIELARQSYLDALTSFRSWDKAVNDFNEVGPVGYASQTPVGRRVLQQAFESARDAALKKLMDAEFILVKAQKRINSNKVGGGKL